MGYISPVAFLNEDLAGHDGEITQREIILIKRKLLAEAELSENKTVSRNGNQYSKDDIIKLFDRMGANLRMDFHRGIFKNKLLLRFLESGQYSPGNPMVFGTEEQEFLDFIQPWFIPVWNEQILTALRNRKFDNLLFLIEQAKIVIDEIILIEELQPLDSRLQDFENNAIECWRRIQTTRSWNGHEVDQYINASLVKFLNALPYTFSAFRNSYMIAMINLTVFIYNSGHKGSALSYANVGIKLECDDYYTGQMNERIALYKSKRGGGKSTSNTNPSAARVIWFVLIIVSAIVRLGTCNDHNYSTNSYNTNPYPLATTPYGDSLLKSNPRYSAYIPPDLTSNNGKIDIAFLDTRNKKFLKQLLETLNKNTNDLSAKHYSEQPADSTVTDISGLQGLIEKGWNEAEEMQYTSPKQERVAFVNSTNTPMVLIYNQGPRLKAITVMAGKTGEAVFQDGPVALIPFFGAGWNSRIKIYGVAGPASKALLNKGWFTNKISSSPGISGTVNLLQVKYLNPSVTDNLIFTRSDFGYYYVVRGPNMVKME